MTGERQTSRKKILAAAADVARETGPGSVSLDAVAARAGVSKGGLLYNFPTKAKLMQALVEEYLAEFETALEAAAETDGGTGDGLMAAYVGLSERECEEARASASWIFSAIAEDPDFLRPIKTFKRRLLDRLKADAPDQAGLLMAFLAVEGLRSLKLFDADILTEAERDLVFSRLVGDCDRAGAAKPRPAPGKTEAGAVA